jgi:TrpR-related protein YerC/YecD
MNLYKAFLTLKTPTECEKFLRDLLTPRELREFQSRWEAAQLLNQGNQSYRQIAEKTGMSVTTIGRVARFLNDEPHQGYRIVLDRMTTKNKSEKK